MNVWEKLSFAEQITILLGLIALIVAIFACIFPIITPEIRNVLGLDEEISERNFEVAQPTSTPTLTYTPVVESSAAYSPTPTSTDYPLAILTPTFSPSFTPSITSTEHPTLTPSNAPTSTSTWTPIPTHTYTLIPTKEVSATPPFTGSQRYPCSAHIIASNADSLNVVRARPTRSAPLVRAVEPGDSVTIMSESNSGGLWYQISYNNAQFSGWIPVDYVTKSANCP